eukprot:1428689-Prymnesium_polylepis.1
MRAAMTFVFRGHSQQDKRRGERESNQEHARRVRVCAGSHGWRGVLPALGQMPQSDRSRAGEAQRRPHAPASAMGSQTIFGMGSHTVFGMGSHA